MSRAGQIALITAGTIATGIIGYAVYFDYMRRNSADFRKGLRKQQKKLKQAAEAEAKEQAVRDQRALTMALVELELEQPPQSPEAMEAYFQEHVATAEALAAKGPSEYVAAATHFYRALRVYPQPVELLMIYQKVCPEPVFQLVLKLTQLTSGAAAGGAGAAATRAPAAATVADIDDAAPEAAAAPETEAVEEAVATEVVAEAVATEVVAEAVATEVVAEAIATEVVAEAIAETIAQAEAEAEAEAEEAEAEAEEEVASEGAPASQSSGTEWERVSDHA